MSTFGTVAVTFAESTGWGMIIYFAVCVVMFVLSLTDAIDGICDWFGGLIEKAKSKFRKTE